MVAQSYRRRPCEPTRRPTPNAGIGQKRPQLTVANIPGGAGVLPHKNWRQLNRRAHQSHGPVSRQVLIAVTRPPLSVSLPPLADPTWTDGNYSGVPVTTTATCSLLQAYAAYRNMIPVFATNSCQARCSCCSHPG